MRPVLILLLLGACKKSVEPEPVAVDADGDGASELTDCNDSDPLTFPGAAERCDGLDNDCDGDASDVGASHVLGGEAGIDLAQTALLASPGDTILLCPGVHVPVVIDGLTLQGSDVGVVIDAAGVGSAVIASGAVALEKLMLRGGVGSPAGGSESSGGGLNAWDATAVRLLDVEIVGNSASFGGGMVVGAAPVILENVRIAGNSADDGGGVHIEGGTLDCTNTVIIDNDAQSGGGVRAQDGSVVEDCVVEANSAFDGGGLFLAGEVELRGVDVLGNTASNYGGGVFTVSSVGLIATGVEVLGNSATEFGGGLFANPDTAITATALVISGNGAGTDGGGAYLRNATITGQAAIEENTAVGFGGGVATFEGAGLTGLTVSSNTAEFGGGLYLRGPVELDSVVVDLNQAAGGAGAYLQESVLTADTWLLLDNIATDRAGGLYLRESTVAGTAVEIVGNSAPLAAGVYGSSTGSSSASGLRIAQNLSSGTGGGVVSLGALDLADVEIEANGALTRGGGVYAEGAAAIVSVQGVVLGNDGGDFGGGLYAQTGSVLSFDGTLESNRAARGAGAYINGAAQLDLTGFVTGNGSLDTVSGGGVRVSEGTLSVVDTTFADNLPDDVYTVGNTMAYSFGALVSFVCTEAGC